MADITWLSVMDEINTPIAINAQPYKNNPNIFVYANLNDTSPNLDKISGYTHIIKTGIKYIVTNAKNLPTTVFPTEIGDVKISWSVLSLRSSATIFIVRIGIVNTKISNALYAAYICV